MRNVGGDLLLSSLALALPSLGGRLQNDTGKSRDQSLIFVTFTQVLTDKVHMIDVKLLLQWGSITCFLAVKQI